MTKRRVAAGMAGALVLAGSTTMLPSAPTTAAPPQASKQVRSGMGGGLGRLVSESQQAASFKSAGGGFSLNQNKLAIRDDQGRVMVQLTPQADAARAPFRAQAERLGLEVVAVDDTSGTLEGFVPLSQVNALASLKETGTIAQALKPQTHVGDATSQGVALQRADKVQAKGVDGRGITVAALSDSYDAAVTNLQDYGKLKIHAKQDVASGDLPGTGNKRNPQPVVVLEDLPRGDPATDEGRAMLQIVHDVAPASRLCFATAFNGLLGFADNIRRLADKKGKCGADVVVDDVSYLDEPMFSDSPLSDAIDDVAAKGTHYFSSAGNDGAGRLERAGEAHRCQEGGQGHQPGPLRRRPRSLQRRPAGHGPGSGQRRRADALLRRRRRLPQPAVGRPGRRRRCHDRPLAVLPHR